MPGGGNNNPTGKGGFKKGRSGNPYGGRRSKEVVEIMLLARQQAPAAIKRLAEIMKDPTSPKAAQVAAAQALLDRGCGKPPQTVETAVKRFDPDRVSDDELVAFLMKGREPAPLRAAAEPEKPPPAPTAPGSQDIN